jgi:hypothetical protein
MIVEQRNASTPRPQVAGRSISVQLSIKGPRSTSLGLWGLRFGANSTLKVDVENHRKFIMLVRKRQNKHPLVT